MATCSEQGEYGRQRLFGAMGWGLFSAVAGSAISHAGIYAAFACHAVLAMAALPPTLALPFGPLHAKLESQPGNGAGESSPEGQAASGVATPSGTAEHGGKRPVERSDSAIEARSLLSDSVADVEQPGAWSTADGKEPGGGRQGRPRRALRQPGVRYWAGVARLLRCPEAAVFLAMSVFMGVGVGNIEGYLFLFLDELGGRGGGLPGSGGCEE